MLTSNHLVVILFGQSVFDDLEGEEMRRARTRANPYEMIRGVFFLNRFADISLPSFSEPCCVSAFQTSVLSQAFLPYFLFQGCNEDG